MAKPVLGLEQAVSLVGRMKAAAEGNGRFSDIVMPNGQKLRDCTFGYVAEISEAMQTMGYAMPEDSFQRAWGKHGHGTSIRRASPAPDYFPRRRRISARTRRRSRTLYPTMVGWQPFDPAGDPVPVIRKQLCLDSVVPWKRRSNDSAL